MILWNEVRGDGVEGTHTEWEPLIEWKRDDAISFVPVRNA